MSKTTITQVETKKGFDTAQQAQTSPKKNGAGEEKDGYGLDVRGSLPIMQTWTVSMISGVPIYGSRPESSRIPCLGGEAKDPAFRTCVYWWYLHMFPTNIHCNPTHSEGPAAPAWTHSPEPMQGHQTKIRQVNLGNCLLYTSPSPRD